MTYKCILCKIEKKCVDDAGFCNECADKEVYYFSQEPEFITLADLDIALEEEDWFTIYKFALRKIYETQVEQFTGAELREIAQKLMMDRDLKDLVDKGYITEFIGEDDIYYQLTDKGKEYYARQIMGLSDE